MNTKIFRRAYFFTPKAAGEYVRRLNHKKYDVQVVSARIWPMVAAKSGIVVLVLDRAELKRETEMNRWLKRTQCAACRFGRCHVHHPKCARREHPMWGF